MAHGPRPVSARVLPPPVATVEVDQGDVSLVVTENGVLESSVDDVVRCRVESLLGLPVGAPPAGSAPRAVAARARAGSAAVSSGIATRETALAAVTKAIEQREGQDGGTLGSRRGASNGWIRGCGTAAAGSSALASSSPRAPFDSPGSLSRSAIRSFDYVVEPHVPLRSTLADLGVMATTAPSPLSIISILAEGSRVKAGEVVCELDSSALRDALAVQQLRFAQAKAWVEQAKYVLEADKIALREYEAGVLPQDIELVRQNIDICRIEKEQAARNLDWSRAGFRQGISHRDPGQRRCGRARAGRDRPPQCRGHARAARKVHRQAHHQIPQGKNRGDSGRLALARIGPSGSSSSDSNESKP